jgi:hypothetical protein
MPKVRFKDNLRNWFHSYRGEGFRQFICPFSQEMCTQEECPAWVFHPVIDDCATCARIPSVPVWYEFEDADWDNHKHEGEAK